jgi:hypothetical protein
LLLGRSVYVIDAATYGNSEKLDLGVEAREVAIAPDGRRVYVGLLDPPGILILEPENAGCSPLQQGLAMFHSGDGTSYDSVGFENLTLSGAVRFTPGRVGQAFYLDGNGFLSRPLGGLLQNPGSHDVSFGFYAKVPETASEEVLMDWSEEAPQRGLRLLESTDRRFEFQSWPGGNRLRSKLSVSPATWYYVLVTKTDREVRLYVNGKLEDKGSAAQFARLGQPLLFGASGFRGWLDEIAFWNRALTSGEAAALYQLREAGPCRL